MIPIFSRSAVAVFISFCVTFSLMNITKGHEGSDSYTVPAAKGVYTYHINCEWFLDQGQAEYFFSIQVK